MSGVTIHQPADLPPDAEVETGKTAPNRVACSVGIGFVVSCLRCFLESECGSDMHMKSGNTASATLERLRWATMIIRFMCLINMLTRRLFLCRAASKLHGGERFAGIIRMKLLLNG